MTRRQSVALLAAGCILAIAASSILSEPLHMVECYSWGKETNGLRVAVATVKSEYKNNEEELLEPPKDGNNIEFRVALQNVGDKDFVLNLGTMLINGSQYSSAITLSITGSNGVTKVLCDNDDRRPGVIGRRDPFVVPLPAGCTYILRINFENYWFSPGDSSLQKGEYQVKAELDGKAVTLRSANGDMKGLSLMPYWTGKVTSGTMRFTVE